MSLMRTAARAANLGAPHAKRRIVDGRQMLFVERRREAWPPRAAFEFLSRGEQRQAAQLATIDAGIFVVEQHAAERLLGTMVQQHVALFSRQRSFECPPLIRRRRREIKISLSHGALRP